MTASQMKLVVVVAVGILAAFVAGAAGLNNLGGGLTVNHMAPNASLKVSWSASLDAAVYNSAGLTVPAGMKMADRLSVVSSWSNPPVGVDVYQADGTVQWSAETNDTKTTLAVSVARHIDYPSAGNVDMVAARVGNGTCTYFGFATSSPLASAAWAYTIDNCFADLVDDDVSSTFAISDSGSTLAIAVHANTTVGAPVTAQLHVVNAQNGSLVFVHDLTGVVPSFVSVSVSRNGEQIAFVNGVAVYSIDTAMQGLRAPPIERPYTGWAHICPMGLFLSFGFEDAYLYYWETSNSSYVLRMQVPGNGWTLESAMTSVNGADNDTNGCLLAFGWTNDNGAMQAKVTLHNMKSATTYWEWVGPANAETQTIPELSMHWDYIGVATWGNLNATSPTILLFNLASPVPIATMTTPGSMFAIDILVDRADGPPGSGATDSVYMVAAGKHMPASREGLGGDAYGIAVAIEKP